MTERDERSAAWTSRASWQGYRAAWEGRDEAQFCALFASDGEYHNTPFATQRGHAQLAAYWQRVKLQEDVRLRYEVLAARPGGGIARWHVTYQVASEELFRIWAQSTGTNLVARRPGDPLPRMVLDEASTEPSARIMCPYRRERVSLRGQACQTDRQARSTVS